MQQRGLGWVAIGLFVVISCGKPAPKTPHKKPEPPKPLVENVPRLLRVSGSVAPESAIQVRNLGTTKMVQFHSISVVSLDPVVPRLAELLQLSSGKDVQWLSADLDQPRAKTCELTQVDVKSETRGGETTLEVLTWGWESRDETKCQDFFKEAKREGFRIHLSKVPVTRSAPVDRVEISLAPESN